MMARLVQSQLIRGMTAFFQRDPRLAEQVTQKPRLDHGAGRMSDARPATDTTRRNAAGQAGRESP